MTPELSKRLRLLASATSVLVVLAVLAIGWTYSRVRASLPQVDGTAGLPGLTARVRVERDALGVPTLHAGSRLDIARALGFVHAQDRFFQMDVWRRAAAGELSATFGLKTLEHDRAMRLHGFRRLAQSTYRALPADQRALLDAYTAGVNAGLTALREKPFEYLVTRTTPQPWQPEDCLLVSDAMLIDLQDDTGKYEKTLMTLRDQLGTAGLTAFAPLILPDDAALDGSTAPAAPLPGPAVINLRATRAAGQAAVPMSHVSKSVRQTVTASRRGATALVPPRDPSASPGSNAFALSGAHTANGAGLLASDIHLTLRVPNVWYRASFQYPEHTVTGITLPGTPVMIAGSNGHVAWSFTNAYADTGDLITLETNPVAPTLYRAPGHPDLLEIETRTETIPVAGGVPSTVQYQWTIWGPVVGQDEKGRPLVYVWTGHDPRATNVALFEMENATDAAAAVAVAHRTGIPAQNIVIADATGNIAWTVIGKLPRRVGYDGRLPVSFQYGDRSWAGFVPDDAVPVVTTAPHGASDSRSADGRIWSANQRMMGGEALKIIGDGGYARPARAAQIRDDLAHLEHATPRDLLNVQLDDHALFLAPWNKLLLDTLSPAATQARPVRGKLRGYAEKWEGRASVEALSYPITRMFRIAVYSRVFPPIFAGCTQANSQFGWDQLHLEPAVWQMLRQKPMHLLAPQYKSWDDLLVAAVDDVIHDLDEAGVRLPHGTWGERNAAMIRHPFSYTLPWFFRSWLDMPADPLPGDIDMPRVQTPEHGASERFVVSPGHESEGIFEMPGGQSGHPLSPYYRAGHEAWVHGDPTPFLPGKTEHTLTLIPATPAPSG